MKLSCILLEEPILIPRNVEGREKKYLQAINKKIQEYIKNGCEGGLSLHNAPITSLPDNLKKVGGHLELWGTKITSLPNNLEIKGSLNVSDSFIVSLPNNLKVGRSLLMNWVSISSLPSNLEVGHNVWMKSTPLAKKYSREEIRKMIEDKGGYVKGKIYV